MEPPYLTHPETSIFNASIHQITSHTPTTNVEMSSPLTKEKKTLTRTLNIAPKTGLMGGGRRRLEQLTYNAALCKRRSVSECSTSTISSTNSTTSTGSPSSISESDKSCAVPQSEVLPPEATAFHPVESEALCPLSVPHPKGAIYHRLAGQEAPALAHRSTSRPGKLNPSAHSRRDVKLPYVRFIGASPTPSVYLRRDSKFPRVSEKLKLCTLISGATQNPRREGARREEAPREEPGRRSSPSEEDTRDLNHPVHHQRRTAATESISDQPVCEKTPRGPCSCREEE
uniref:Uncharacterized protein n=1 Tax=Lutzomyia longipalpis TaxID=7200 RepID=A0A1B0EZZ5_LUTLO